MEDTVASPTVMVVEEEMEAEVAVMVAVPCPELVATPLLPRVLLMIATVASDELHITTEVTSSVLPSVYVPVAANGCVVPSAIVGLCGVIAIEANAAGITINWADPLTPAELIPIVVVPVASVVAAPPSPSCR